MKTSIIIKRSVSGFLAALLVLILAGCLLSAIAPAANAQTSRINSLDITCTIDARGDAVITQVIDLDANKGTEYYQICNHMGDSEITSLAVEENGVLFQDVGSWDTNASDKLLKSGIVRTKDGYELCFGIGAHGHHTFRMTYSVSNFISQWADSCGVNYIFFSGIKLPITRAAVTVTGPEAFSSDNAEIWAFRYEGTVAFEDGSIIMDAPQGVKTGMQLLMHFISSPVYENTNRAYSDWSFQRVYDDAVKGSSYHDGWIVAGIFGAIALVFGMIFGMAFRLGEKKRYEDKSGYRQAKKTTALFRDIPCGRDLVMFSYFVTDLKGSYFLKSTLISAYILRWVQYDLITAEAAQTTSKRNKHSTAYRLHFTPGVTFSEAIEQELYDMLCRAAGNDFVLESSEFENYCEHHDSLVNDWFERFEQEGKQRLIDYQMIYSAQVPIRSLIKDSRTETTFTAAYNQELACVKAFRNFLVNEDNMPEKSLIEVKLWDEYLVFAAVLGIADQVYRQVQVAVPSYSSESSYDPMMACMAAQDFGKAGKSGLSAAADSSGSGGGSTAGGGGGGGLR